MTPAGSSARPPGRHHKLPHELDTLLRRLIALGEEQTRLLRRLSELLQAERGPAGEAASPAPAESPLPEAAPSSGGLQPGQPSPWESEGRGNPQEVEDEEPPPQLPSWVDEMVRSALSRAFDSSAPIEAEDAEAAADVAWEEGKPPGTAQDYFLLMGDGAIWVGFPWERAARISLVEEDARENPLTPGPSASLQAFLRYPGHPELAEPYRVSWEAGDGISSVTCARLGGVISAQAAGEQGMEAVVVPDLRSVSAAPKLMSLVEYLARPAAAALPAAPALPVAPPPAPVPPVAPPPAPVPPTAPTPAPAAQVLPSPAPPVAALPSMPAPALPTPAPAAPVPPAAAQPSRRGALLAVRYLPARVALSRALRNAGWSVQEILDPLELRAAVLQRSFEALFVEFPERAPADFFSTLQRAAQSGTSLIAVRSRLRTLGPDPFGPLGSIPRLFYPFQDAEMDRILAELRPTSPIS